MSFRIKRARKQRPRITKRSEKGQQRPYLITFGEGSCDCPICREMGIDLDATGGIDARPLDDPEQFERVLAMLEAARLSSNN